LIVLNVSRDSASASMTFQRVAFHQHDVAGLDGDVRACADGYSQVRLHERRCVIDAVAHEGDALSLLLKNPHLFRLVLRQNFREHPIDADLLGDHLRGLAVVAGNHHRLDALGAQVPYRGSGVFFQGIGDGNDADKLAIVGNADHSLCIGFMAFYSFNMISERDAVFPQQAQASRHHGDVAESFPALLFRRGS